MASIASPLGNVPSGQSHPSGPSPRRAANRCDVDWHVDRGIVAVACLGQDMIEVWPLPVEQPWGEDAASQPRHSALHVEPGSS
jgi:hypothetical protein